MVSSDKNEHVSFNEVGSGRSLKVLKFGGSSVRSPAQINRVTAIVKDTVNHHRTVVVVSAVGGVTNLLRAAAEQLNQGTFEWEEMRERLYDRHLTLARELIAASELESYIQILDQEVNRLEKWINDGIVSPETTDQIVATGERLAAPLIAFALRKNKLSASHYDTVTLVRTDDRHGNANVKKETTFRQIREWFGRHGEDEIPVVTGFIGATNAGSVTTLGRSGSDYSAALFACALKAYRLERWTDVDGLYNDDPRKNPKALRYEVRYYQDIVKENRMDKLGLHPQTLAPLIQHRIPVHVRCTAAPHLPGTLLLP